MTSADKSKSTWRNNPQVLFYRRVNKLRHIDQSILDADSRFWAVTGAADEVKPIDCNDCYACPQVPHCFPLGSLGQGGFNLLPR